MSDHTDDRCVLCLDDKRSPVRIQCGHTFCHECLEVYKSYRKYSWANKCPICRSKLKQKKRKVKNKSSSETINISNPIETSRTQSTSSETAHNNTSSNAMLEQFIAIATDSGDNVTDSFGSSQLNRSALSAVDTNVTPMQLFTPEDSDSGDEVYGYADDDDDDDVARYFSNSDEDNYYYYFEEDQVTWHQQQSSMVEADDYEHEVVIDPDDAIIVDEEGSWVRMARGQTDSDVVIVDEVIIVD